MRLVSAYHLLLSLPSRSLNSRPPHVALSHHVPSPFFCSIADAVTWEYKHRERGEDKRPIDKYIALLITLKRLGTNASFESIALYLGVSVGSAARCVDRMTKAIIDAFEVEIRLPRNTQECAAAAKQFVEQTDTRLRGVIGSLDGTHFRWTPRAFAEYLSTYFNRKMYRSVLGIAVVDAALRFRFFATGWPGSTHDSPAASSSGLYEHLADYVPPGYFIVADAAFAQSNRVVTPFRFNGLTSQPRRRFNYHLSKARVQVERAFGQLKGRWRCLRDLKCDLVNFGRIATTCAILHNICINRADTCIDEFEDLLEEEERRRRDEPDMKEDEPHPQDVMPLPAATRQFTPSQGNAMRLHLVNTL